MALFVPGTQEFTWTYSTSSSFRPNINQIGNQVTPGINPTYGNWVSMINGANLPVDIYGITICINFASSSATTRNYFVDVGIDSSGGTSYTVKIPQLLGGHAAPSGVGSGGIYYYFPLFINRGSSIAVRATGTTASILYVDITLFGRPRHPDAVKAGTYVTAFGAVTGTSSGTVMTSGQAAPGTQVQLGTTTKPYWWWQAGYSCIDTTMATNILYGFVNTSTQTLVWPLVIQTTALEQISTNLYMNGNREVATGSSIFGSLQMSSATLDNSTGMMAYGLGG